MHLDRKMVGFFGTSDVSTAIMIAPYNIFRTVKVRVPPFALLTSDRERINGNEVELFIRENNHTEVKITKSTPIPIE